MTFHSKNLCPNSNPTKYSRDVPKLNSIWTGECLSSKERKKMITFNKKTKIVS